MIARARCLTPVLGLLLTFTAACDNRIIDSQPTDPPLVVVEPSALRLGHDQGVQLQLTIAESLAGRAVEWTSNNPAVARVSEKGMVRAIGDGVATITATVGSASAFTRVIVQQNTACPVIIGFFVDCP